jgi:hypothetical protein
MTSYYPLAVNSRQAPTFMPTLDGEQYNITVIWNVSARRSYVQCQDLSGNLIFFVPLVETQPSNLLTALTYDSQNTRVVGTTTNTIYAPIGQSFYMSIINTTPSGYNGSGIGSVLNSNQFTYPLSIGNYPGIATTLGALDILISLCKGYFNSTLVYRNRVFEVNP